MRHKRIKVEQPNREINNFYKCFSNSLVPARGRETIIISPKTFSKVVEKVTQLQFSTSLGQKYLSICVLSSVLQQLYFRRFNELNLDIPRRIVSYFLTLAVQELRIDPGEKRISLNSLNMSGRLIKTARKYGMDLKLECQYWGIPYI